MLCLPAIIILGIAFYRFWTIRNTIYILTEETLKIRTGIFSFTLITLELYRVKDYILTQSFIMRILKIMTLTLITTDKQDVIIALTGVKQSTLGENLTDIFSNHFVSDLKRIINLADELDDKWIFRTY